MSENRPVTEHPDERTWIFDEGGVRFFLLTGDEKALLIDSGMKTRNAKELAREYTDLPLFLLNTHADGDHTGSNAEFDRFFMHPAEGVNYYNKNGAKGEFDPVWDGDVLDLGSRPLQIIEMPGHTPGSIAVLDTANRRLISGDPIQRNGHIFMFGPYRDMHAYRVSLKRLEGLTDRFDEIWPSHGDLPLPPSVIPALYEEAGRILRGEAEGKDTERFGNRITVYNTGTAHFLCAPREKDGEA